MLAAIPLAALALSGTPALSIKMPNPAEG